MIAGVIGENSRAGVVASGKDGEQAPSLAADHEERNKGRDRGRMRDATGVGGVRGLAGEFGVFPRRSGRPGLPMAVGDGVYSGEERTGRKKRFFA